MSDRRKDWKGSRVGVLFGGPSSEREVSLKTGKAVLEALLRRGHDAVGIDVDKDLPAQLVAEGVEVAWLALHGALGEDGCVQGLLEVMQIPYTGSGVLGSALAMDKFRTKRVVAPVLPEGVSLAGDAIVVAGTPRPEHLGLPLVLKTVGGGSTVGLSILTDWDQWDEAVTKGLTHSPILLAEAFVDGLELTCAVLEGQALPLVAIEPADGLYDYDAKYVSGGTRYTCPAPVSEATRAAIAAAAVAAGAAVGCSGSYRADFIVRADGTAVMLEINTLPGMTERSLVPMAAKEAGLDFDTLVERILGTATRHADVGQGPEG